MTKRRAQARRPALQEDESRGQARQSTARRLAQWSVVPGLLGIHVLLAATSVRDKCVTYDELAHLTRGYGYRLTGDFRLGPPHPPLAHYWAAIPNAPGRVAFPSREQSAWYTSDVWKIGRQFFYSSGNDSRTLLFRGRLMIAALSVALGVVVFAWSRQLFGWPGGVISLALYAFSPTVLASARLVTTDMAVSLFFTCALGATWWVLHKVSPRSVVLAAGSMAGLFLSKMSAPLIISVGVVLLAIRLIDPKPLVAVLGKRTWQIRRRPARLGIWCGVIVFEVLVTYGAIWAAYGFRYDAMAHAQTGRDRFYSPRALPEGKDVWEDQSRKLDRIAPVVHWLREHRVLPEAYLYSALMSAQTARGRAAFLNGRCCILGFRSFFPYTFLYKTPLPLFGILVLAASAPLLRRRFTADSSPGLDSRSTTIGRRLLATAPLWAFLLVYWAASIRSHLNIGHRHILPTYPILFILCGAAAGALRWRPRPLRWIVPALVGLFVAASLSMWPNYLAYFNALAGGPRNGYRHLVDSSLDWGQDLPSLKKWLDARQANAAERPVYLAYFGQGNPAFEGIRARLLRTRMANDGAGHYALSGGVYCISATQLQQVYVAPVGREPVSVTWTNEQESRYREVVRWVDPLLAAPNDPTSRTAAIEAIHASWERWYDSTGRNRKARHLQQFKTELREFPGMQFARLCAYLREREPDGFVGYSILIYELTDSEVHDALFGPISESGG